MISMFYGRKEKSFADIIPVHAMCELLTLLQEVSPLVVVLRKAIHDCLGDLIAYTLLNVIAGSLVEG